MSENDHSRFDLEIKALMDSAEEEVPQRVWESVCNRLDSIGGVRKPLVPVWLRRTAAGVAVAAAVAAVSFLVPWNGRPSAESGEDIVAVVPQENRDNVMLADVLSKVPETDEIGRMQVPSGGVDVASGGEDVVSVRENVASGGTPDSPNQMPESVDLNPDSLEKGLSEQSEILSEPSSADQITAVPEDVSEAAALSSDSSVTVSDEPAADSGISADESSWIDADQPEGRGKIRAAINISGNAMTNTKSKGMAKSSSQSFSRPGYPLFGTETVVPKTITETGTSSYGIPVSFGFGAKFFIGRRWAVGAGLNYTIMTRSFKGIYIDPVTSSSVSLSGDFTESKIRNSISYIGIPLNAYFSIIRTGIVDFYVYAGGSAEKCVANVYKIQTPAATYKENVKGFQFSVGAGLGVEFVVADVLGIYADPSVRYYFKDATQPKSIRTENPVSFGFEIGLRIRL